MSAFTPEEAASCRRLVELALEEDLGARGDVTSQAVIPPDLQGQASFVARAEGTLAGLPAVELVLQTARTPLLKFQPLVEDGTRVRPGDRLATVSGLMEFILTGERTALNFLQRLSGIATLTRRYVDAVAELPCKILDTRKTTPGWRLLEKYAVRCGGGHNHRMGLHDGLLIKDNHVAALGGGRGAFQRIFLGAQKYTQEGLPLEIEVDSLDQLIWAFGGATALSTKEQLHPVFGCGPNIILLDNMTPEQLREAVQRRNHNAPSVLLEASGGITLANVRAIAETGVDRISVGALTHSAPALDIALDYQLE